MRVRRAASHANEDYRTVQRVRLALEGYAATAPGKDVSVNVAHVLDLLNPRGLWSLDPERARKVRDVTPDADPLTGCAPVTAPPGHDTAPE